MMSPQHFHSPNSYLLSTTTNPLIIIIVSIIISSSYCGADDDRFTNCSRPYNCGDIQGVVYPFWGGDRPEFCGRPDLGLDCDHNKYSNLITGKRIQPTYNQIYRVLNINQSDSAHTMTIVPKDLFNNICPKILPTSKPILNYSLGNYAENVRQLRIFYGCRSEITGVLSNFKCTVNGSEADGVIFPNESVTNKEGCLMNIVVPVVKTAYDELWDGTLTLLEALNQGYDVDYKAYHPVDCSACADSGGICGSDSELQFRCFCPDKPYPARCPSIKKHGINRRLKLIIGASVSGSGILCICMIICCCRFRKSSDNSILFWMKKKKKDQDLEALIRHLAVKRYSYSDIKKMTNAFRDKLGQGGYGDVYKGILLHGRHPVAVKILKESKGNGEEFINEVVSISRTSHVNVVTLLGFCLEGHKRALIYDFMPNGSLEKYILYGQIPQKSTGGQLGWEKLYQISVGIARGLEYLHRGCNTRILHFDIKPHNILLDEDFCPKISDFGLAKLCSRKESIVSMLEARGTIGYIAPEVFSRNFGGVSSKSDVYSYGMMVLEMVGGRKNIDVGVSRTSKIYFPQWVYSRLELDEDLELQDIIVQEEYENARKMILVGLWCIQTDPSQRPSMNKVIDMLEGRMEDLHIPPKPFL